MRERIGVTFQGSDSQCRRGPIPALPRYLYPPAAASLSEIVGLQKINPEKVNRKKSIQKVNPVNVFCSPTISLNEAAAGGYN